MNIEFEYKKKLSEILNSSNDDIFLYWKGRVALYSFLKAINIKEDDEIIIPAYTCVVVANAIIYLGAKPIYVDIDIDTYNANIDNIKRAITSNTKAIICQNTFGLSSNIEEIIEIANKHNLYTIEDCTHGFGGTYKDKPNGTYCDAAFFSTQWNKPFSTGIGGFLLINNKVLIENVNIVNKNLLPPSIKQKTILKILYFAKNKFLLGSTYWILIKIYRFLSKNNLVVGSSSGIEIASNKIPKNYFMSISDVQIKEGLKNLNKLNITLEIRTKNAQIYSNYLLAKHKNFVPEQQFKNHSFLKYPLLVKNRETVFRLAEKYRIELGDWLNSPIHPVQDNFKNWFLNINDFPNAEFVSKHIINLPTDSTNIEKVLKFLEIIDNYIINIDKNI